MWRPLWSAGVIAVLSVARNIGMAVAGYPVKMVAEFRMTFVAGALLSSCALSWPCL